MGKPPHHENGAVNGGFDMDSDGTLVDPTDAAAVRARTETADNQKSISILKAWRQWPKCVFLIIGNEFCERFNYYGMRAVLLLYLLHIGYNNANATAIYHGFTVLAYFTPLLGAYLADGYIGKYWTILWFSLVYAAGSVVLAIASMSPTIETWLSLVGLILIAFGTGGIKPCVSPFGADQFRAGQENLIQPYFSVFYFSINAGSLLTFFVSPMLSVQRCMGETTCYPGSFGVPAMLMLVAVGFFLAGSFAYRRLPPKFNALGEVAKVIYYAIRNRFTFSIKRDHWVEHYLDNHSCNYDRHCIEMGTCHKKQFVEDVKGLFSILILYLPCPIYWALYDQQGSRWVIQVLEMDYRIGGWTFPPALVQAINPILILAFIPLFSGIIYPFLTKIGLTPTPLRRMAAGLILIAISFVMSGLLQLEVNKTLPVIPDAGKASLRFVNTLPCDFHVSAPDYASFPLPRNTSELAGQEIAVNKEIKWTLTTNDTAAICETVRGVPVTIKLDKDQSTYYVVLWDNSTANYQQLYPGELQKSEAGLGQFKISVNWMLKDDYEGGIYFCSPGDDFPVDKMDTEQFCDPSDTYNFYYMDVKNRATRQCSDDGDCTSFAELLPGVWRLFKRNGTEKYQDMFAKDIHPIPLDVTFSIGSYGGIYALTIYPNETTGVNEQLMTQIAGENTISFLFQLPQIVVVTASEILFSITGLEFSYSQSPQSMKSVLQAVWLLVVSFGDLIILIVAEKNFFPNLAIEMFFYAGMMVVVTIIFIFIAMFVYKYNDHKQASDEQTKPVANGLHEDKQ